MMSEDESGTLALLQGHRSQLLDPAIARHHGRIVKLMGDGLLAEFASVVEAVDCAAEIQREMAARKVHRVVVYDREGKPVGIVSSMYIVRALAEGAQFSVADA